MIGTGIFTTTGLMLASLQSGWLVMLCWLLGGLVALCGALSYAELAVAMPEAGAEYAYLREIYGPLPAFLSGWISFLVGFSASIAASAVACAEYLSASGFLPGDSIARKSAAAGIVLALTFIHYCGVRVGGQVQNVLTGLNVILLGALVAWGFLAGQGDWRFLNSSSSFWAPGRSGQLGVSLLWVMFAYSGWNASAYLAEEVEQPERALPRSLFRGTVIVTALYLLLNLLLFYAAPPESLAGVIAVGKVGSERLFGAEAAKWLSALVSLVLLSALSAYVFIGPRVYYAMARDGLFFRSAMRVHPRFKTPGLSILAQGFCAAVIIVSGTFEELLTYAGFALGIFPCLAVAGLFRLRRSKRGRERPYSVPGYPLVPAFYLAATSCILIVALANRPGPSLAALASVAAGIPIYFFVRGKRPSPSQVG